MKRTNQAGGHAVLPLIEQIVMLLVFMIAAAVCLRAFVGAYIGSAEHAERDRALTEAQSAVELCKAVRGDMHELCLRLDGAQQDGAVQVRFDEEWNKTAGGGYTMTVRPQTSAQAYLGQAEITVAASDGRVLCTLCAAWQTEVSANG